MECNKDEALRAKEIAEGKFRAKEFEGAKKFALKASQLYPALDGVTQMLATFDVYLASEKKINGEMDWYEILCVNSTADDEMVRKQYRKLALILHPDKNKSVGAEGAFKLISEAWSVLSDKLRRSAYDHKRNFKGCAQKAAPTNRPAAPPRAGTAARGTYGYNFASTNAGSNSRTHKAAQAPPPVQRQSKSTFWTSCSRCRMQYEYLRIYVNHNLLCPNCHEPFLAIEMGTVPSASGTFPWTVPQQNGHPNQSMYGKNFHASQNSNLQCGQHSRTSNVSASNATSYPSFEKIRREEARYKSEEFKKTSGGLHSGSSNVCSGGSEMHVPAKKQRSMDGHGVRANDDENMGMGDTLRSDVCKDANETERVNGVSRSMPYKQYGASMKDFGMQDIRTMLILKARQDIEKKFREWNSEDAERAKEKRKAPSSTKENGTSNGNGDAHDESKSDDPSNQHKKQKPLSKEDVGVGDEDEETDGPSSIHVIDPDFYDFDNDRTEKSFEANQVWAAYDDDDGMPRFYAFVQKVLSVKPFKMRISWLHSKSNSEVGPINWVGSGFTKTSGEFRVSRYAIYDNVNVFSHKVRWNKGLRGVIRIFPRKGDIWAIYRNWSKDWDESTPNEVIHRYDMVEVLNDLVEDQGISIALLVKVPGFKTVFQRVMDSDKAQTIPREELFRFSHKVPSRLLTGEEAENAPKGCLELDPAATPLELLQVITEAKNDEIGAGQETGEQ